MIRSWQIQEAKNKLSQVVEYAMSDGPQIITRHGTEVAIVLAYAEYQRMTAPAESLSSFFQRSPLAEFALGDTEGDGELDLARDRSGIRSEPIR